MTYSEKLKDPRWQKKRLIIMQRDEFTCQCCLSKEKTLHVHHKYYEYGKEPWDYPDRALVTLCFECHDEDAIFKPCFDEFTKSLYRLGFINKHFETISADGLKITAANLHELFLLAGDDNFCSELISLLQKHRLFFVDKPADFLF